MSRKALTFTLTVPVPSYADVAAGLQALPVCLGRTVLRWQVRASQRVELQEMDEHMRRDIGLSYEDCLREARKPFWRS